MQLPGNVDPERGACPWSNTLFHTPLLEDIPPKNRPAHLELLVSHGEISGAPVEPRRRLCDCLSLCKDWSVACDGVVTVLRANDRIDKAKATAKFEKLCEALANVGLQTEVRNGDSHSVLLFVRVASDEHLFGEVYRSRQAIIISFLSPGFLRHGSR